MKTAEFEPLGNSILVELSSSSLTDTLLSGALRRLYSLDIYYYSLLSFQHLVSNSTVVLRCLEKVKTYKVIK